MLKIYDSVINVSGISGGRKVSVGLEILEVTFRKNEMELELYL